LPSAAAGGARDFFAAVRGIVKNLLYSFGIAVGGATLWLATSAAFGGVFVIDKTLPAPTSATQLIYSPDNHALVLKNTASTIAVVDVTTGVFSLRSANTRFTDITLSPSRRYVFAADYGGENIGYGTPAAASYVHRLDLSSYTWDLRSAFIAGRIAAVSDTQVLLASLDQWITFTNNRWDTGPALVVLNTSSNSIIVPGYYAGVYFGDFRYDFRSGRLIHGDSGSSSQEVQAFKLLNNEFVKQEASGTYGSAQGYGGTVALAADGSAFYYGRLQIDPLDVTHNLRLFPEPIYAATGQYAFGDGKYYDAHTGNLLGLLPFSTTVYAMNAQGSDFWAYDAATSTLNHFKLTQADPVWDVLWRHASGVNAVWQFTGPALAQFEATFLPSVAPDWNVIAFGDINGDGVNDVVWMQPSTGQVAIWLVSSPSTVITATYPARLGASTHLVLAGAGDIDGNGRAELLWRDSVTGRIGRVGLERRRGDRQYTKLRGRADRMGTARCWRFQRRRHR
jgi:hypothetical protein